MLLTCVSPLLTHMLQLSHHTSLTKYKLKDKVIENSKTEQQSIKPILTSSESWPFNYPGHIPMKLAGPRNWLGNCPYGGWAKWLGVHTHVLTRVHGKVEHPKLVGRCLQSRNPGRLLPRTEILTSSVLQTHLEGVKIQISGPTPRVSDLVGLGGLMNWHFHQISRWCWCCWYSNHTWRTTAIHAQWEQWLDIPFLSEQAKIQISCVKLTNF